MRLRTLPFLFTTIVLLLAGCRAAGPEQPARTVTEFFRKYESRSGFKAQAVEANFATRLLLGQLGRFGGDSEVTQALSSLRAVRVLTFTPTSVGARSLASRGLVQEVEGLLQNERYEPLPVANDADATTQFKFSARRQGDRVQEVVGTSQVDGVPDSFVLMAISGNFTDAQLQKLLKFLPGAVQQLPK